MGKSRDVTRSNAADVAVLAAAPPTILLLLIDPHGPGGALLTLMGLAGATGVAVMVRRTGALPRVLWPVVGLLTLVAVARAPLGSHDIWSSAFYGRVVARYGADPYTSVAKSYPAIWCIPWWDGGTRHRRTVPSSPPTARSLPGCPDSRFSGCGSASSCWPRLASWEPTGCWHEPGRRPPWRSWRSSPSSG